MQAQSQEHHAIDRLEKRGADDSPWKDEKGLSSNTPTSAGNIGETSE